MMPNCKDQLNHIFMLRLYLAKLPQQIQEAVMELITLNKAMEKRLVEQNYVQ